MIEIAFKMLFGDRAKYLMLITGVSFATLLMTQGLSMFFGIISFSYATATNIRAEIWVADPLTEQVADNQPLRDTDINRVRSVDGVEWASPLFVGTAQARLVGMGRTKPVTLVGLDADTFAGAPTKFIEGSIAGLQQSDSVVIDSKIAELLSADPTRPLRIGDVFEMNDRRATVAGVVQVSPGMGGAAYVFTTWDRAKDYAPNQRKMLTYVLASPAPGLSAQEGAESIQKETGLQAMTERRMKQMTSKWMILNSPVPVFVGVIVAIGFLMGVVVSGQTFYTFVLENTPSLGALKAMGADARSLAGMIVAQALTIGLVGFGIGSGLMAGLFAALPENQVPLLMLWPTPTIVLIAILGICVFVAIISVYRVSRIEPAIVFRT